MDELKTTVFNGWLDDQYPCFLVVLLSYVLMVVSPCFF